MAQDFRFASLRRRFNLTSPSMPNLCGPEVSDRASSVLEPNRAADADAAAHNDSPDNNSIAGDGEETPHQNVVPGEKSLKLEGLTNNAQAIDPIEELKRIFSCEQIDNPDQGKEDDDTIEEVPRASTPRLYQEPFDALCFRLQDQLGIAGYPRLVLPGETTFGAWDGFANDTQRRLNDVMHRYLDFFRAPRTPDTNFSLAIPPRGIVDISPKFYEAFVDRPELMHIVFNDDVIEDKAVRLSVGLNRIRINAALAIEAPPPNALPRYKAPKDVLDGKTEIEDVEDDLEAVDGEADIAPLDLEEVLSMKFGILQKFLNLEEPNETQIRQLQNFMTNIMANFTWDTSRNALQVWQGRGQGTLEVEQQCQDMALAIFRRKDDDYQEKKLVFMPQQDDPLFDGVRAFLLSETWVQKALVDDTSMCLDDILMWLIERPLGLETLRSRWLWDLQIAQWKHDRLVMQRRNIRVGMQLQKAETFSDERAKKVLNRLREKRSARTATWGDPKQRARWDAQHEVRKQKRRIRSVELGIENRENQDLEDPSSYLEMLRERADAAQRVLDELADSSGESTSGTSQTTESSDHDPFELDQTMTQPGRTVPRMNGSSRSSMYSRSTTGRPYSHLESSVDDATSVPTTPSFTHTRSLAGSRTQFPPLDSIIEGMRDPRPESGATNLSLNNTAPNDDLPENRPGQVTPIRNEYEPRQELHTNLATEQIAVTDEEARIDSATGKSTSSAARARQDEIRDEMTNGLIPAPLLFAAANLGRRASLRTVALPENGGTTSSGSWADVNEVVMSKDVASARSPIVPPGEATDSSRDRKTTAAEQSIDDDDS